MQKIRLNWWSLDTNRMSLIYFIIINIFYVIQNWMSWTASGMTLFSAYGIIDWLRLKLFDFNRKWRKWTRQRSHSVVSFLFSLCFLHQITDRRSNEWRNECRTNNSIFFLLIRFAFIQIKCCCNRSNQIPSRKQWALNACRFIFLRMNFQRLYMKRK